jgi:hypothetical protein
MPRKYVRQSKESKRRKRTARVPHLFGRGGRDRVLICLAVNGAMHVRAIARAIGSDSHKTYDMVERLLDSGIVVKRNRAGGRKYVQLNRNLRIHPPLLRLLEKLDDHWPAQRVERSVARWYMPFHSKMPTKCTDLIFQSPVRSRVLLFVAAVGRTNMRTMYDMLGIGSVSALYAANHWEREGILKPERVKRDRLLSLNPSFEAAKELRALLREIVANSREYRSYRAAFRRRARARKQAT